MMNIYAKYTSAIAVVAMSAALYVGGGTITRKAHAGASPQLPAPKFAVDPFWPRPLPNQWVTGEVGGSCVDAQDHVFILSRDDLSPKEQMINKPAPPVIELDINGNVVNSWGDPNLVPGRIHGCFVDGENNVWVAGQYDAVVQKYSHDGKLLLQLGQKGRYDTSDGTGDGAAMNSSRTLLNQPAAISVDPANGDVYIADGYGNRRVVVFDKNGHFLRQWGRQGTVAEGEAGTPDVFVQWVHCLILGNDGLVYVCDRRGDRIEVFDKMGRFKKNIYIQRGTGKLGRADGSAWWIAFSPDPEQKYMYVADGGNEKIWILDHALGEIISSFGQAGHQTGEFTYVHTICVDSKGNIIAAETIGGRRVQKFKLIGEN
jgi:DNA-binding beta-propeller fold protein YncE